MKRTARLTAIFNATFNPLYLNLIDESHQHRTEGGDETHLKIILVSTQFENQSPVKRHQAVYRCLNPEFSTGLHAVTLHLFTPAEWEKQDQGTFASPPCRGGFHEH